MSLSKKVLATVSVGVAAMLLWVSPASAQTQTLGGNIPGRANADSGWDWRHSSIRNIYIGVDDLRCDAEGAYAYLRIYQPGTEDGYVDRARVDDACGGGPFYRRGLNFDGSTYISGVRLVVCVDSTGVDTCDRDQFVRNPIPQ
ncbi:MAG: hypothetical protein ACRDS9_24650 [Pseudonocardiaceae bacterium]